MLLIRFERNPRLQDDDAVRPPLHGDIPRQPFDLAKGRFCQHRGGIPTHVSSPGNLRSLCEPWLLRPLPAERAKANYFGAMRIAPSSRMVSPFSIGFSTMCTA